MRTLPTTIAFGLTGVLSAALLVLPSSYADTGSSGAAQAANTDSTTVTQPVASDWRLPATGVRRPAATSHARKASPKAPAKAHAKLRTAASTKRSGSHAPARHKVATRTTKP